LAANAQPEAKFGIFSRLREAVRENYRPAIAVWATLWVLPAGAIAASVFASGMEASDVLAVAQASLMPLQPLLPATVVGLRDSALAAAGNSGVKLSREGTALLLGALGSDLLDPIRIPLVMVLAPRVGRAWRRYRGLPESGAAAAAAKVVP